MILYVKPCQGGRAWTVSPRGNSKRPRRIFVGGKPGDAVRYYLRSERLPVERWTWLYCPGFVARVTP